MTAPKTAPGVRRALRLLALAHVEAGSLARAVLRDLEQRRDWRPAWKLYVEHMRRGGKKWNGARDLVESNLPWEERP